jgi:hypothetical protein
MVDCNMARYHPRCVRTMSRPYNRIIPHRWNAVARSRRRRLQGNVGGREVKTTDASVIDREGVADRRAIKATKGIRPAQDTIAGERLRQGQRDQGA